MENGSDVLLTDDQHFLLYIIMGAYFAPDLKEGRPHRSALQRFAEGLPQYHANNLVGSHIKTMVLESVYYYTLREAEQSVVVKQPLLLQYIHGSLPTSIEGYLQFDDLFPRELHQQSQCENELGTIDNIVLVDNPEMEYMKPEDIERFKRLTRLEDFVIDRDSVMLHMTMDYRALYNADVQETWKLDVLNYAPCTETYPDGNVTCNSTMPFNVSHESHSSTVPSQIAASYEEDVNKGMIFLPSCPSTEEWSNLAATINCGFALTGSAARGHLGPVIGLMDIGESDDSYLFRVSLPGVRRDEREFSCEVESDGTVIIKGVTVTGERTVEKYSQVFEMRSQNLCPPGPFSISFKLPGPVDPQQFHGTFASDGILEGIALKSKRYGS